jgi:hypothetical protein
VHGTIIDPLDGVIPGAKVTFVTGQLTTSLNSNNRGVYELDLPLGDYTMTVQSPGFRPYRRPLFRAAAPASLTFDVTLTVAPICDLVVVPLTPESWAAAEKEFLSTRRFFPIPSKNGVPFQPYIRYVKRVPRGTSYAYGGQRFPNEDPVFVAYNLFLLQADRVTYDERYRIIEASGNVIVGSEPAKSQRADFAAFKLEDGQAVQK